MSLRGKLVEWIRAAITAQDSGPTNPTIPLRTGCSVRHVHRGGSFRRKPATRHRRWRPHNRLHARRHPQDRSRRPDPAEPAEPDQPASAATTAPRAAQPLKPRRPGPSPRPKTLRSDSLSRWLTEQGFPTTRPAGRSSYRKLKVDATRV